MKLARVPNEPSALLDFFQQGLESLGAICERTWHDRLQVVAEGASARLWDEQGALLEAELHFVAPNDPSPREADREVFPGCPLTFRLAEALRHQPVPLERALLQVPEGAKPPSLEVAEKLWHAQIPGTSHWRLGSILTPAFHFSLAALARCELQAIDQHWSVHRIALSLPHGERDEPLALALDFAQAANGTHVPWPGLDLQFWEQLLGRALEQDLAKDLGEIRQRQQQYLRRELGRIDTYFEGYERELTDRAKRSHSEGVKLKARERLAAAKAEHARRREDQVRRHEIRIISHLDALLLLAEPAWQAPVSFLEKGVKVSATGMFVPRARRWIRT